MDLELLRWIHANWHQSDIVNQIMKCITISGNGGIIWIVTGVLLLLFRKTRIPGLVMLISLAAGFILNDFYAAVHPQQLFAVRAASSK